ncbi:MAG: chemotaxis protein CheW [Alteromonadaceae bacterium]|mgnify:CR=1 FL=1|uniref:chemotaxis protein CheV n=1 Tax=unclassified Marinobacter TaxID=83889 RepID=UPI000C57B020|nr:chemotaxis protein CheV [Marinobacter sp. BGYM27]MAA63974.1 chemotaxis protein CheW [Alteromonadaceae bacterium]MBH85748.1 chemotaxis protein CheW [Alteromonadaceae bacterium]MDG5500360.1 chemotaxis protein CheV [Marinobacter sp. BGYM27]|tara:strand:- start:6860 stop:7798 length:939 start_codon:yes stop_codon:yes gene_type:complete
MAGVLDSVNQRTQLVGQNRLELLLFRLMGRQVYGINVFKVKEVLQCPKLSSLPKSNAVVRGVAHIRGETLPIIDLGLSIGMRAIPAEQIADSFIIITEYNRRTQGFLVAGVDRIVNLNWEDVSPPPKGAGKDVYLTAVARIEEQLIEIIDVEKILSEVSPLREDVGEELVTRGAATDRSVSRPILVVDDSSVARRQVERCLRAIGFDVVLRNDGKQALDYVKELVADGSDISDHLAMMISDVEMPEMDGYTLVTRCKEVANLKSLYILLHTSLSGVFNKAMVQKVGADDFMAKFSPDELAERIMEIIDQRSA